MLLIKNGIVSTMSGSNDGKKDILIDNGKIVDIKDCIDSNSSKIDEIIDAAGLNVLPGIIDAHVHTGVMSFDGVSCTTDTNEMSEPICSQLEVIYSADPLSCDFKYTVEQGITSVCIAPGSSCVIGGTAFAAKTYGDNIFDMLIKKPVALKVAMGENPKIGFGYREKSPKTRMEIINILVEYLKEAQDYMFHKQNNAEYKETKYTVSQLEPGVLALENKIPLKVHSTRHDMIAMLNAVKEFNLKITLDHAWGAEKYCDEIIESKAAVVFGPIGIYKGFGEGRDLSMEFIKKLDDAGTDVVLITDAPILSPSALINTAGEAVRSGCKIERALRMITINPAKIMGIDDRVGSIEIGKDADIAIFEGMPAYDMAARAVYTIVDGKIAYKKI